MNEQPLDNKIVTGGIGLTAGRDASIGDVSGQVAIGEYINQFMIRDPSGEALVKLMDFLGFRSKKNFAAFLGYNYCFLCHY